MDLKFQILRNKFMILKIYLYQSRIILHFNFEMNWLILGKICLFKKKNMN